MRGSERTIYEENRVRRHEEDKENTAEQWGNDQKKKEWDIMGSIRTRGGQDRAEQNKGISEVKADEIGRLAKANESVLNRRKLEEDKKTTLDE